MEPNTYSSLHHAVAFLERRACMDWMSHYGLGTDLELTLAEHVRNISVTYQRSPGTNVAVIIRIACYRTQLNDEQYFSLQRAGNRAYMEVSPTSTEATA